MLVTTMAHARSDVLISACELDPAEEPEALIGWRARRLLVAGANARPAVWCGSVGQKTAPAGARRCTARFRMRDYIAAPALVPGSAMPRALAASVYGCGLW